MRTVHLRTMPRSWLAYVAPVLLLVVALAQVALVATADLSPWKGGGYGMFSTVDTPQHRLVVVTDAAGQTQVLPHGQSTGTPGFDHALERARTMPDDRALQRLAERWPDAHANEARSIDVRALRVDDGMVDTVSLASWSFQR